MVMCLLGEAGIQDVIAFPKTMTAADLLCQAPAAVDEAQLIDLGIQLRPASRAAAAPVEDGAAKERSS